MQNDTPNKEGKYLPHVWVHTKRQTYSNKANERRDAIQSQQGLLLVLLLLSSLRVGLTHERRQKGPKEKTGQERQRWIVSKSTGGRGHVGKFQIISNHGSAHESNETFQCLRRVTKK